MPIIMIVLRITFEIPHTEKLMRDKMNYKMNIYIMLMFLYSSFAFPDTLKTGMIDTIREDGFVTVIFEKIPDRNLYYIFTNEKIIGNISST